MQTFNPVAAEARLPEQVADALAADIRTGRLAAGGKLPAQAVLATHFLVSRTVVREAVSRLKSLGLVDSRQGSGVYVNEPGFSPLNFDVRSAASKQAGIQIVEVRRALESEVAELAAQRRSQTDLRRIRKAITLLDKAVLAGGDGVDEDVQYHRAIAEAARNPFLMGTLDYFRQFLRGATRVTRANEARREDFMRQVRNEHELIVCAIEAGDAPAARQAAAQHMNNAVRRIEQAGPVFWEQAGVRLASSLVAGWPMPAKPAMPGSMAIKD